MAAAAAAAATGSTSGTAAAVVIDMTKEPPETLGDVITFESGTLLRLIMLLDAKNLAMLRATSREFRTEIDELLAEEPRAAGAGTGLVARTRPLDRSTEQEEAAISAHLGLRVLLAESSPGITAGGFPAELRAPLIAIAAGRPPQAHATMARRLGLTALAATEDELSRIAVSAPFLEQAVAERLSSNLRNERLARWGGPCGAFCLIAPGVCIMIAGLANLRSDEAKGIALVVLGVLLELAGIGVMWQSRRARNELGRNGSARYGDILRDDTVRVVG